MDRLRQHKFRTKTKAPENHCLFDKVEEACSTLDMEPFMPNVKVGFVLCTVMAEG
jgi:hypothetical protein